MSEKEDEVGTDETADKERYAAAIALTGRERLLDLSTIDEAGYPETRALFNLLAMRADALSSGPAKPQADFATYIATNASSRKMRLARANPRACLYYCDRANFEGCSVRGTLAEITDPEIKRAIWTPEWEMYYHGGLDGGDFAVLRFEPEHVRYYHGLSVSEWSVATGR
jgi:general stress protein 26